MSRGPQSRNVGDYHAQFVEAVRKYEETIPESLASKAEEIDVLEAKQKNAFNGFETSTFTVCSRIRPVLPQDNAGSGENFKCIVPGPVGKAVVTDYCEPTMILTPKVSMMGKAQLDKTSLDFDFTFGPDTSVEDIFTKVGRPLVEHCMAGKVGVIFAYGQTASGKTHTMNGLMDQLVRHIYGEDAGNGDGDGDGVDRQVTFSYVEILGQTCTNCLAPSSASSDAASASAAAAAPGQVKIGEMLDGRVEVRNLAEVSCPTASTLRAQVAIAKAMRATECTERNSTSSRSHGIGILTLGAAPTPSTLTTDTDADSVFAGLVPQPAAGRLYIIDLAGSERIADSKNHTNSRMEETKAINMSLMSLKECIRARTLAGLGDGRTEVHVPYRRSKLTLLMKDVFDISCRRMCSTVVLAHVSPLARDVKHSTNTLQYAAPLRVSARSRRPGSRYEVDARDPANWAREQVAAWVAEKVEMMGPGAPRLSVDALLSASEAGLALCMLPEAAFYSRVQQALADTSTPCTAGAAASLAAALYTDLWTMICDAKVRRRHPDGRLVSETEEAADKVAKEKQLADKSALWAEREAHMKSDLVGYDGKPI